MQFTLIAALALATSVAAMPRNVIRGFEPFEHGTTVKQAAASCGDKSVLACCGAAHHNGNSAALHDGLGSGLLSDLFGSGSGAHGVLDFDDCSKIEVPFGLAGAGIEDILDSVCKRNVACCQKDATDGHGELLGFNIPCVGLGTVA